MFDCFDNLKLLSSYNGASKPNSSVENRKSSGFLFRISGEAEYIFTDRTMQVKAGEMIFVPQGCSYSFASYPANESHYVSINFIADIENPRPEVYIMENFASLDFILNHFTKVWKMGNSSDKYKCISIFYELLAYLSNFEHAEYSDKHKKNVIKPALEYMREHIFDSSLSVETLSDICGISDTYFRKIFVSNFGITPQKYIVNKRISHAKAIIDSGDFDTISEIALSVGYTDPLYFSRAFKNKYGVSPSEIK